VALLREVVTEKCLPVWDQLVLVAEAPSSVARSGNGNDTFVHSGTCPGLWFSFLFWGQGQTLRVPRCGISL